MFYSDDYLINEIAVQAPRLPDIDSSLNLLVIKGYVKQEGNRAPLHIDSHDYTQDVRYEITIDDEEIAKDYANAIRAEGKFELEECVAKVDIDSIQVIPRLDPNDQIVYILSYIVRKDIYGKFVAQELDFKQVVGPNQEILGES